mmetsp:Transcript_514/g.772  ORF Transcript_514/g.772 Transcript_514/m.772 type:complete len:235 (-) Transcript_514:624-1328(-)
MSSEDHTSEDSSSSDAESSTPEEEDTDKVDPLKLDPPSFSLPGDDFELWTMRLPQGVDPSLLNGIKISTGTRQKATVKAGDTRYGIALGDAVESESFRVLVENAEGFMIPATMPFVKSINIVNEDTLKDAVETELAPSIDRAPTPVDDVRHAYSTVPQRSGLKRRWMPMGVGLPPSGSRKDTGAVQKKQKGNGKKSEEKATKVELETVEKEKKTTKKDKKKSKKKRKKAAVKEE